MAIYRQLGMAEATAFPRPKNAFIGNANAITISTKVTIPCKKSRASPDSSRNAARINPEGLVVIIAKFHSR
jgi:hypothetical protein